jgi:hypothetical protein
MIQVVWERLAALGTLTNQFSIDKDAVTSSARGFVCALPGRLSGVRVASMRPIELTRDS